ncbi:MAG: tRNA (N(6)-L-threonylcarbamoyladenosine(37)-C(2))-methylthiotransferase MtaB [Clostridia bacterium]|nr:tRNA (N(6)-L-threonylcarbamoyladenosine(37)-C(2))-methylthiotransferase MtaB [Clostridia bacterium]
MRRTAAYCTLGCKVNQYDTQAMRELLECAGFETAPFSTAADVYVINTCTVTGTGDKKSRQMIRRANAQNPKAVIVVTGCMAQRHAERLLLPGVKLVLGTQRRLEIASLLARAEKGRLPLIAVENLDGAAFERLSVRGSDGRTRATLKIQEGCDGRCSYCVIPAVRGKPRSRHLDDARAEAERLADAGFQEIVIAGIHLSSYGKDFGDPAALLHVIESIAATDGIKRIRLGSLEPSIITETFVRGLGRIDAICPQFMLALQSGSDPVLRRMGRRYTAAQYRDAACLLRMEFPNAALTTDLMVGFPGETEAEFEESVSFIERMRFARIHVFPYSEREGTRAADMAGRVPKSVREIRASRLIDLGARLHSAFIDGLIGSNVEVLFEERTDAGACGYAREYVRVAAPDAVPGEIRAVKIVRNGGDYAVGTLCL